MSANVSREQRDRAAEWCAHRQPSRPWSADELARFWSENDHALSMPWSPACPHLPLGIRMAAECIFAELGIPEDWHRLYHDPHWNRQIRIAYNDRAEREVGRRLLDESPSVAPEDRWPEPQPLHALFGARNVWHNESYWLESVARTPAELVRVLDETERRIDRLRDFLLPPEWDREKARLRRRDILSPVYRGQRGPVTFAMSLYGPENLIFLILDHPAVADRFRDVLCRAILERVRVLDAERESLEQPSGESGWRWADDNCCLLNAELYNRFALPILEAVYRHCAPNPGDRRYQHSDSDMAQHLPTFARVGMNAVNFGPNLSLRQIRTQLPAALIHGQLAPFTFSRNQNVDIVAEVIRDAEMARDARGVIFATAGSINNGSSLSSLRLIMAAIREFGAFDGPGATGP